jgi:signal recognition particle subunit SRP54
MMCYMLDTAGRLHIDEVLMEEVAAVRDIARPRETLLVVDGLTGQDAVNVAHRIRWQAGHHRRGADPDGWRRARRRGAQHARGHRQADPALSGLARKLDAHRNVRARADCRAASWGWATSSRWLKRRRNDRGRTGRTDDAPAFRRGQFNLNDLKTQLEQMQKMGGMEGLLGMMPGMGKMSKQLEEAGIDDAILKRQIALIQSMTRKERANPQILQASRKKRIAAGAGQEVPDLNRLLKQHRQMSDMMKRLGKKGGRKALARALGMGGGPGGLPPGMGPGAGGITPPAGMGGMPGLGGQPLPPGLSGLGKKK